MFRIRPVLAETGQSILAFYRRQTQFRCSKRSSCFSHEQSPPEPGAKFSENFLFSRGWVLIYGAGKPQLSQLGFSHTPASVFVSCGAQYLFLSPFVLPPPESPQTLISSAVQALQVAALLFPTHFPLNFSKRPIAVTRRQIRWTVRILDTDPC